MGYSFYYSQHAGPAIFGLIYPIQAIAFVLQVTVESMRRLLYAKDKPVETPLKNVRLSASETRTN